MNRYPEYKDSGIEWVGEIPKNWEIKKLTYIADSIGSGTTPKSDDDRYYANGNFPWLISGDLKDGRISAFTKKVTAKALEDYSALKVWPKHALAIAMYGATIGKIGLLQFSTTVNQACCVCVVNEKNSPEFWMYSMLASRARILAESYGGGQPNISQEILKAKRFVSPPKVEQLEIADYLDKKTTQIDSLIEKLEKKIEALKEYRVALISQCVTKGLDPDAEMKDSGIEWIGEIPKGWNLKRLNSVCDHITEKRIPSENDVKISPENVEAHTGKVFSLYSNYESEGQVFRKGDILFNKLRVYLNKVVLSKWTGLSMGEMIVLRPITVCNEFVYRVLSSGCFIDYVDSLSEGVKMPRPPVEGILKALLPIPNGTEQLEISLFICEKTSQIDSLIEKLKKKIELLKEYRQSLISNVVTGKIRVT